MRTLLGAAALSTAFAAAASAQSYRSVNNVAVTPVADGGFQVSTGNGYGARGMWCAAADYAQNSLGVSGTTRVYIVGPRVSARSPVTFSTAPGNTAPVRVFSIGASLRQAGSNLSVDHAY